MDVDMVGADFTNLADTMVGAGGDYAVRDCSYV